MLRNQALIKKGLEAIPGGVVGLQFSLFSVFFFVEWILFHCISIQKFFVTWCPGSFLYHQVVYEILIEQVSLPFGPFQCILNKLRVNIGSSSNYGCWVNRMYYREVVQYIRLNWNPAKKVVRQLGGGHVDQSCNSHSRSLWDSTDGIYRRTLCGRTIRSSLTLVSRRPSSSMTEQFRGVVGYLGQWRLCLYEVELWTTASIK